MYGTGVPIVTPFDDDGDIQLEDLSTLTAWVSDHVDFVVACGSTGEAPLMGTDERTTVVETVVDATSLPVVAGTGHPGRAETVRETERAARVGAAAALVVTPFYYDHDVSALVEYYRSVANESPIPIYVYNVPKFTGVALRPRTIAELADHPNIAGIKDSSGSLASLQATVRDTRDAAFEVFVGSGSIYGPGLDAGVDGGILAVANAVPEVTTDVYEYHQSGQNQTARDQTVRLQSLNRALTTVYGVPGVKAAVTYRGYPAGRPRAPLRPLPTDAESEIQSLVETVLD